LQATINYLRKLGRDLAFNDGHSRIRSGTRLVGYNAAYGLTYMYPKNYSVVFGLFYSGQA